LARDPFVYQVKHNIPTAASKNTEFNKSIHFPKSLSIHFLILIFQYLLRVSSRYISKSAGLFENLLNSVGVYSHP